jgi:hypothetical protein
VWWTGTIRVVGAGCLSSKQIGQGQGVGHDGRGQPWFVGDKELSLEKRLWGPGTMSKQRSRGDGHMALLWWWTAGVKARGRESNDWGNIEGKGNWRFQF